jgi:hypothetical protein
MTFNFGNGGLFDGDVVDVAETHRGPQHRQ